MKANKNKLTVIEKQIAELNAIADKAEAELVQFTNEDFKRSIGITDILSRAQVRKCLEVAGLRSSSGRIVRHGAPKYKTSDEYNRWLLKEIIEPNIVEINNRLGQENDLHYLMYIVAYIIEQMYLHAK